MRRLQFGKVTDCPLVDRYSGGLLSLMWEEPAETGGADSSKHALGWMRANVNRTVYLVNPHLSVCITSGNRFLQPVTMARLNDFAAPAESVEACSSPSFFTF